MAGLYILYFLLIFTAVCVPVIIVPLMLCKGSATETIRIRSADELECCVRYARIRGKTKIRVLFPESLSENDEFLLMKKILEKEGVIFTPYEEIKGSDTACKANTKKPTYP